MGLKIEKLSKLIPTMSVIASELKGYSIRDVCGISGLRPNLVRSIKSGADLRDWLSVRKALKVDPSYDNVPWPTKEEFGLKVSELISSLGQTSLASELGISSQGLRRIAKTGNCHWEIFRRFYLGVMPPLKDRSVLRGNLKQMTDVDIEKSVGRVQESIDARIRYLRAICNVAEIGVSFDLFPTLVMIKFIEAPSVVLGPMIYSHEAYKFFYTPMPQSTLKKKLIDCLIDIRKQW